jgi:pSer/pThr/pTyr-binding forkhead associated (FHA) protein
MIKCPDCGHLNDAEARFCGSCGAVIAEPSADDTTIIYAPFEIEVEKKDETVVLGLDEMREDVPVLLMLNGPGKGEKFRVETAGVLIGRHPEADVFLSDITVSREHAAIELTDQGYLLRDKGSLNGTYLNRVEIDKAVLNDLDELQIGKFKMIFLKPAG